jgi:hypothetical protein
MFTNWRPKIIFSLEMAYKQALERTWSKCKHLQMVPISFFFSQLTTNLKARVIIDKFVALSFT